MRVDVLDRVTLLRIKSERGPAAAGLCESSMDVILDDGDHWPQATERTLAAWWPIVRPGGLYILEDVATGANLKTGQRYGGVSKEAFHPPGFAPLVHNVTFASPAVRRILEEHDSFFVDTLVGHRNYRAFKRRSGPWMKDRVNHNSHVLVLRKRAVPRVRVVQSNTGVRAMSAVF